MYFLKYESKSLEMSSLGKGTNVFSNLAIESEPPLQFKWISLNRNIWILKFTYVSNRVVEVVIIFILDSSVGRIHFVYWNLSGLKCWVIFSAVWYSSILENRISSLRKLLNFHENTLKRLKCVLNNKRWIGTYTVFLLFISDKMIEIFDDWIF